MGELIFEVNSDRGSTHYSVDPKNKNLPRRSGRSSAQAKIPPFRVGALFSLIWLEIRLNKNNICTIRTDDFFQIKMKKSLNNYGSVKSKVFSKSLIFEFFDAGEIGAIILSFFAGTSRTNNCLRSKPALAGEEIDKDLLRKIGFFCSNSVNFNEVKTGINPPPISPVTGTGILLKSSTVTGTGISLRSSNVVTSPSAAAKVSSSPIVEPRDELESIFFCELILRSRLIRADQGWRWWG